MRRGRVRKLEIADHQARKEVVEAEGVKKMVFLMNHSSEDQWLLITLSEDQGFFMKVNCVCVCG